MLNYITNCNYCHKSLPGIVTNATSRYHVDCWLKINEYDRYPNADPNIVLLDFKHEPKGRRFRKLSIDKG